MHIPRTGSKVASVELTEMDDNQELIDQFFKALPEEAKKYFVPSQKKLSLDQILNHRSSCDGAYISLVSVLTLYPLLRIQYVSANEIVRIVRHGIHELFKGPGYFTSEGLMDVVLDPLPIGVDIIHGPVKLIYVRPGSLKYALDMTRARPMLLEPGMHYFDDINIIIDSREILLNSRDNSIIPVGDGSSFNFIVVKTGSNGVVNRADGSLQVLKPGIHFCESPDTFKTFVSVQQEFVKIVTTADSKFLTADNIELDVQATLFYKISNVEKAFTRSIKDNEDLHMTLLSQARALLTTLLRSEYFSDVGKRKMNQQVKAGFNEHFYSKDSVLPADSVADSVVAMSSAVIDSAPSNGLFLKEASAPAIPAGDESSGFQTMVRDIEPQFMEKMRAFGDEFGFEVQSLRIENIHYADKAMQQKISQLSLKFAELAQQQATLAVERRVEIAQAEREKQQLLIRVQGEAERKTVVFENERSIAMSKNKLENDMLLEQVRAKTNASSMEAEAEARNKIVRAEAEAEYIRKIGEAQFQVNSKNASLPFADIRIVTDAQKEALAGIQKIVYTSDQNMLLKPYMNLIEKDLDKK